MWTVVVGDPISGFEFYGVFEKEPEAVAWAERSFFKEREWWIALVNDYRDRLDFGDD